MAPGIRNTQERERALLLVDVDGVISLFGAGTDPGGCVPALVEGIPHLLSRRAGPLLARLAPAFECVWCTGWEDRADGHLPHLICAPAGWPHIVFPDRPEIDAHWKLSGIDAFAGRSRPLAWIDDAHDARCHAWAQARQGPTLLVATETAVGLTDAHAEELEAWAAGLAAPASEES